MTIIHLTYPQRYSIEMMLKSKIAKKTIWNTLDISESTFYRKLKYNSKPRSYNAKYAQILADERQKEQHVETRLTQDMFSYNSVLNAEFKSQMQLLS